MKMIALVIGLAGCPALTPSPTTTPSTGPSTSDDRATGAATPAIITVPETNGMTRDQAEKTLRAAGVHGSITVTASGEKWDELRACGTTPGAGNQTRSSLGVSVTYCQTEAGYDHDEAIDKAKRTYFRGMTVEAAEAAIKNTGFDGRFEVQQLGEFDASCPKDGVTVCRAEPEATPVTTHVVTLWTNHSAKIVVPD